MKKIFLISLFITGTIALASIPINMMNIELWYKFKIFYEIAKPYVDLLYKIIVIIMLLVIIKKEKI